MLAQWDQHNRLQGLWNGRKNLLCFQCVCYMLLNVKIIIKILITRYLRR